MPIPFNPYSYPGSMPDPADEELYQKNSVMAPQASRLRKIMDFVLGGKTQGERMTNAVTQMAPAAIIPGQRIKNVLQGNLSKEAKSMSFIPDSRTIPYAYGSLDDLPLNSQGAYSALYDPATGKMGYTEGAHIHAALQKELKSRIPNIEDENVQARIRRQVYTEGGGRERGTTTIIPPYTKPNVLGNIRRGREQAYFERIARALERKGLIPSGEEVKNTGYWQD